MLGINRILKICQFFTYVDIGDRSCTEGNKKQYALGLWIFGSKNFKNEVMPVTGIGLSVSSPYIKGCCSWPWKQSRRFTESTNLKILLQTEFAFLILPLKILCWMTLGEIAYVLKFIYFPGKEILLRLDYF